MIEAGEQCLIEKFVTHPPVKTLDERILGWLSRGRIMPFDTGGPTPLEHRIRGQLSSIIADYHGGLAAHGTSEVGFLLNRGFRACAALGGRFTALITAGLGFSICAMTCAVAR